MYRDISSLFIRLSILFLKIKWKLYISLCLFSFLAVEHMEVKTVQLLGIFIKDLAIGTKTTSQVSCLIITIQFHFNKWKLMCWEGERERERERGVTTFRVNKSYLLFNIYIYYFHLPVLEKVLHLWNKIDILILVSDGSLVPQSCCDPTSDMDRCQGLIPSNSPPSQAPPVVNVPVNYTLYTTVSPYTQCSFCINRNLVFASF